MDEPRFYQRPWFYIFVWSIIGGGFYYWQARTYWLSLLEQGQTPSPRFIVVDVLICGFGLLIWLAFFSQFVLPVKTFRERQKIFDRLLTYLSGGHGPAIFIENGRVRESWGERKKKGPGVLWLDSASAAVTRTATSFKQTIGPGVHFTDNGESIASTVDLHTQKQTLGPRGSEDPFAEKKDNQGDDEYDQIQKRRMSVSAWTRDGIEVVPNVTVIFKIDADPVKKSELPGSRFGYSEEAVFKAIVREGINPGAANDAQRRRVAWNQLPALIAVDIWREYLAKFKFGQLFEESQRIVSKPITPLGQIPAETQAIPSSSTPSGGAVTGMLRALNSTLASLADRCENGRKTPIRLVPDAIDFTESVAQKSSGIQKETALQTINRMIKARMTEPLVEELDEAGNPSGRPPLESDDFKVLRDRGIRVISVSVGGLRFPSSIEEQLVRQWSTTWLDSAKAEHNRIERLRGFEELDGQVDAALIYAQSMSLHLIEIKPEGTKGTLKTLLLRSRDLLVNDDRMHRRASMEREELEELIRWVEGNGQ
jgi:hypothetical protein